MALTSIDKMSNVDEQTPMELSQRVSRALAARSARKQHIQTTWFVSQGSPDGTVATHMVSESCRGSGVLYGRGQVRDLRPVLTMCSLPLCLGGSRCPAHWTHRPTSWKKNAEQDSKRLISTSSTPRSTTPVSSGGARAPHELDRLMGIGSMGSLSGEVTDSERDRFYGGAAEQKSRIDSTPNIWNSFGNLSGVDGCPGGYGSASLADALDQHAQLEVPAACASQGVIEHLRNRETPPRHVACAFALALKVGQELSATLPADTKS